MIFTKTPITEAVLIRFYKYTDPDMGYGDAGTAGYIKVDPTDLIEEVNETVDGEKYYTYNLKAEPAIEEMFGKEAYMYYGYTLTNEEERLNEVAQVKQLLKALEVKTLTYA